MFFGVLLVLLFVFFEAVYLSTLFRNLPVVFFGTTLLLILLIFDVVDLSTLLILPLIFFGAVYLLILVRGGFFRSVLGSGLMGRVRQGGHSGLPGSWIGLCQGI